jgi:tRNA(Leu) C34 or U34 (ribose-2'-O)-methylase TrmL
MADVFLHAPQDFRNLCAIARTLEVLGHVRCYVFDPYRLVRERYGKSRARELRDVSGGAFHKLRWERVDEPTTFVTAFTGRVVATVAASDAVSLTTFEFQPDDLLVFGGESRGLPSEIVSACDAAVTIPSKGQTQSLNLAIALGVVVFEAERQGAARVALGRAAPTPTVLGAS